jgi:hypothetical protein
LTPSRFGPALVAALLVPALTGCGGGAGAPSAARDTDTASGSPGIETVDQTICRADATAAPDATGKGFPSSWVFPPETTVYHREDRRGAGVILTAVTQTPFDDVLHFLNTDEVARGFAITDGETEEDDAEANWTSPGYVGRWTIRKSGTCPGETVLQVFAATR